MYPGGEFPQGPMGQWRLGHPELQVYGSICDYTRKVQPANNLSRDIKK